MTKISKDDFCNLLSLADMCHVLMHYCRPASIDPPSFYEKDIKKCKKDESLERKVKTILMKDGEKIGINFEGDSYIRFRAEHSFWQDEDHNVAIMTSPSVGPIGYFLG